MTHRSDRVILAAEIARCEPQHPCDRKNKCARYLAAIPAKGASMIGAGLPLRIWYVSPCAYFKEIGAQTAREVPRVIKPAVKGIA
jgi:hypothetical protein